MGAFAGAATSARKGDGRDASAEGAGFVHHAGGENLDTDADAEGAEDDGALTSVPAATLTATAPQPTLAARTRAPASARSLPRVQPSPYGFFLASLPLQSSSKRFLAASEPFMPLASIPRATAASASHGTSGHKR